MLNIPIGLIISLNFLLQSFPLALLLVLAGFFLTIMSLSQGEFFFPLSSASVISGNSELLHCLPLLCLVTYRPSTVIALYPLWSCTALAIRLHFLFSKVPK